MKHKQCSNCYSVELPSSIFCSQCAARLTSSHHPNFQTSSNNNGIFKPLTIVFGILALVVFGVIFSLSARQAPTDTTANKSVANTKANFQPKSSFDSSIASLQGNNEANNISVVKVDSVDTSKIYGNKKSFVYHWFGCPDFSKISPKNRIVFNTVDEAEAKGYLPASNCDIPAPKPESEQLEADYINPETNPETSITPYYSPSPFQGYDSRQTTSAPITTTETRPLSTPSYSVPTSPPDLTERRTTSTETASGNPTAICADGTYSYSQNNSGTCSHHGGVSVWLNSSPESKSNTPSTTYKSSDTDYRPKTVNVRGYTRKDGTYVAPHTRRAPRRN